MRSSAEHPFLFWLSVLGTAATLISFGFALGLAYPRSSSGGVTEAGDISLGTSEDTQGSESDPESPATSALAPETTSESSTTITTVQPTSTTEATTTTEQTTTSLSPIVALKSLTPIEGRGYSIGDFTSNGDEYGQEVTINNRGFVDYQLGRDFVELTLLAGYHDFNEAANDYIILIISDETDREIFRRRYELGDAETVTVDVTGVLRLRLATTSERCCQLFGIADAELLRADAG